jgi:hypothetical protein
MGQAGLGMLGPAIVHRASPDAGSTTGAVLRIDGGAAA